MVFFFFFPAARSDLRRLGERHNVLVSVSEVADEITAARVCCGGCGITVAEVRL